MDVFHRSNGDVPKTRRKISYKKLLKTTVLVAVVFAAGVLVGDGRLHLRSYSPNPQNAKLPARIDYSSVDTIYKSLRENYDGTLDEQKLLDGIKSGLAKASGDPYTEYFSVTDAKDFYGQLDGTFEGIGAELGKDEKSNIIVISPLAGYPAEKAGLKPKDIIAEIDGKSAFDITVNDAVKQIRGAAGTTVKLTIVRDNTPIKLEITREKISIPSIKQEIRDGIGIMTVSRFGDDTAGLSKTAADSFKAANVKGVVLDLRGDPGGLLDAAVSLSSLWLNGKTVLTERRGDVIIQTINSHGPSTLLGVPTIVLINGGSASASEITAGALKDNKAATLIGTKSFGKGSVQQPINLADGSLLKVTIARWFTPAGKNIDKEGIEPDKKVDISDDDVKNSRDPQLDAALAELK